MRRRLRRIVRRPQCERQELRDGAGRSGWAPVSSGQELDGSGQEHHGYRADPENEHPFDDLGSQVGELDAEIGPKAIEFDVELAPEALELCIDIAPEAFELDVEIALEAFEFGVEIASKALELGVEIDPQASTWLNQSTSSLVISSPKVS